MYIRLCICGHSIFDHAFLMDDCFACECKQVHISDKDDPVKLVVNPPAAADSIAIELVVHKHCQYERCKHPWIAHDARLLSCTVDECPCCMYRGEISVDAKQGSVQADQEADGSSDPKAPQP